MTLEEIKRNGLFQTAGIAEAAKDQRTMWYIMDYLQSYFTGNYGEIPPEDTDANNAELAAGEGRILARYKQAYTLTDDIYIQSYFSQSTPGPECNNTLIMYRNEY